LPRGRSFLDLPAASDPPQIISIFADNIREAEFMNWHPGHVVMIELTRLNGSPLVVNCDLIKYVESSPDTTLTLVPGEKIVVRESCAIVIARVVAYRTHLLREAGVTLEHSAPMQSAGSVHAIVTLPRIEAIEANEENEDSSR
jgi:flagellar protein FlbD